MRSIRRNTHCPAVSEPKALMSKMIGDWTVKYVPAEVVGSPTR